MKQSNAIKILAAIAHDGRLSLIRRLIQAGPEGISAGELARFAKIGATTASAQLLVLANAGLVHSSRTGRRVNYRADYQVMSELLGFLMQDCCSNQAEICASVVERCGQ